jgi:hypothetical protein
MASSTDRAYTVRLSGYVRTLRSALPAMKTRPTSSTIVRFSGHPCVPLVQWFERHGLCRSCNGQASTGTDSLINLSSH